MKKLFFYFLPILLVLQSCLKDNEDAVPVAPSRGTILEPNVGGPSQPNQVFIDLSKGEQTYKEKTSWDLGFYTGKEFKVILNYSILMAAGKIPNVKSIDDAVAPETIKTLQQKIKTGTFDPSNEEYIDNVEGQYATGRTAIAEVSANDNENEVYLVNLGTDIYRGEVAKGSVNYSGDPRGWMKVQLARKGEQYILKYAKLNEKTHHEVVITKNPEYNFTFFSFNTNQEVLVQPEKRNWDIQYSVFTNVIDGHGSYIYSDFVLTNTMSNVGAYEVNESKTNYSYNDFTLKDVDPTQFKSNDQRVIGSNWRDVVKKMVFRDRFFVVKDAAGNIYKIKFTSLMSKEGVRGYPEFEYELLK